ncbi:hypothetical protein BDV41DRAFT_559084 [Aspergillus transmontanensis]|uniref:Uncharacterized protein n=1 Tax=Aspergillus transmontanensis TaxID=1034304 RepID=A0A5N6VDS9_9EURO|nr:hypothetical protein BDV41DRAFT_559084 [Aspergillus transmontanensis]
MHEYFTVLCTVAFSPPPQGSPPQAYRITYRLTITRDLPHLVSPFHAKWGSALHTVLDLDNCILNIGQPPRLLLSDERKGKNVSKH